MSMKKSAAVMQYGLVELSASDEGGVRDVEP
jgi:hypothetical protein